MEEYGIDVQHEGLPPGAQDLRVLCSVDTYFTATQATSHLDFGKSTAVTAPIDDGHRLPVVTFGETMTDLRKRGKRPSTIVTTAGGADFGSIDSLGPLAERVTELSCWYHAGATWGGTFALSNNRADELAGIETTGPVTADFHRLFYQPVSCDMMLVRDTPTYDLIDHSATYLNPVCGDGAGMPNPVSKSAQITRRFDTFKPFVTM